MMFKNKQWLEFTGTIENYICDEYPTAYDIFKKNWQWIEDNYSDTRPVIKVKKIVTIKKAKRHICVANMASSFFIVTVLVM